MTTVTDPQPDVARRAALGLWLRWTLAFVAYPLAGLAGLAAAGGQVDSVAAALLGGTVTGLVLGVAQSLAAGPALARVRWTAATAAGLGVGLTVGAASVRFATDLRGLVVAGALTGLVLGAAQAVAFTGVTTARRVLWAVATPALWALGWTVTTLAGVDVGRQYTVFGATGAITVSALSGLLLLAVLGGHAEGSRR